MNATPTRDDERGAVTAILAMARELEPLALAELERALRLKLQPPKTAAARRVAELGFLAKLIEEQRDAPKGTLVPRSVYDERRPLEAPDAPDSKRLLEKYGWWNGVCRAASSMRPDGRIHGEGVPYANAMRGRKGVSA